MISYKDENCARINIKIVYALELNKFYSNGYNDYTSCIFNRKISKNY